MIDPVYPGITDRIIDLAQFIDSDKVIDKKEDIIRAKKGNKAAYRKAFNYFKAAKFVYEEIEANNRLLTDGEKINKKGRQLIDKVFSNEEKQIEYNGFHERYLFSSAFTPEGFVDYTKTILDGVGYIYYIKGEVGTGKSLLLNRMVDRAKILNYSVEIYYNSMFPNKIESLYIKDLDVIITSNKLAEDYAKEIIDFGEYIDIDKLNKEDYKFYDLLIDRGIESLSKAKDNHFILEKSYNPAINYDGIDNIRIKLLKEILG